MTRITAAIAQQLALGARDVLSQAGAVLTGNQAEYIANGEPQSVYGKIQQATARQACRRYADDPSKFQGAAAVAVENACRPYLGAIGYGKPPVVGGRLRGGQCPGVLYRVEIRNRSISSGATLAPIVFTSRVGPISVEVSQNPSTSPCNAPNVSSPERRHRDGNGVLFGGVIGGTCSAFDPYIETVVTRQDGLPDDCGDSPPDIGPGLPPTVPGPRRERYRPGPDIDIDIDIEIGPDGGIDVDFGTGPISIDPFPDVPEGEPGDGGAGGPPPGDVGQPGGPVETGPGGGADGAGGDAEGEAPSGSVLTGLRLEVLSVPDQRKRFTPEVLRGVCYVYMGVPGLLDHDPAGAMLTDDQFVFAEKENLTAWRVRANFGYNIRVTPYYREVE